jgi:hypothetical protein
MPRCVVRLPVGTEMRAESTNEIGAVSLDKGHSRSLPLGQPEEPEDCGGVSAILSSTPSLQPP